MAGNVWEWVSSAYWPYPYNSDDGREYIYSQDLRVLRGGSWNDHSHALRTVNRLEEQRSAHRNDVGFRCARSP
jgi:formylglycine-generating enzyme required for sulfatase activity